MEQKRARINSAVFPIEKFIRESDDLPKVVADSVTEALEDWGMNVSQNDVVGVTESVVAKIQGNIVSKDIVARDIREKTGGKHTYMFDPIFSTNRFSHIVDSAARAVEKLTIVLRIKADEVGNSVIPKEVYEANVARLDPNKFYTKEELEEIFGRKLAHSITGSNYTDNYKSAGKNVEVFYTIEPTEMAKELSQQIPMIAADIHTRFDTEKKLRASGAQNVFRLDQFMTKSIDGSGYNPEYGLLGANLSGENSLKLFPRNGKQFVEAVRDEFDKKVGVKPEVLIFGDGAFKDPQTGIWELADPTTSPGYSDRLAGSPNEIKLKFFVDSEIEKLVNQGLTKTDATAIAQKKFFEARAAKGTENNFRVGTTPRKYFDLIASMFDLAVGSGDRMTPIVVAKNYFNDDEKFLDKGNV